MAGETPKGEGAFREVMETGVPERDAVRQGEERRHGFWCVRMVEELHGGGVAVLAYQGGKRSPVLYFEEETGANYGMAYHSAVAEWVYRIDDGLERPEAPMPGYVGDPATDYSATSFARHIAMHMRKSHRVERFLVSPSVWLAMCLETDYGSTPGTRFDDELELALPGGWVPVIVDDDQPDGFGAAVAGEDHASMDFTALVRAEMVATNRSGGS